MSGDRWDRAEALFHRLAPLGLAERAAVLAETARQDAELAAEVESLLAAHDGEGAVERAAGAMGSSIWDAATRGDLAGRSIRQYQVGQIAGRGGMGVVYRARDTRLGRDVALKFLPVWLGFDPAAKERFLVEARVASALDHPNVCTVFEIGESDEGDLFLAMPFYEGETLRDRLLRGKPTVAEALDIARQIAEGLAAAHERGIVHRDIKPGNLLLTRDGRVKILDFGIAKLADVSLTRTGERVGTAHYMSPEQAGGEQVDGRSDLWSLGVVLHEMLSGARPMVGQGTDDSLGAAPPAVAAVVRRLLQIDPADRYPDAGSVAAALTTAALAPAPPPLLRRGRHRQLAWAAVALLAIAIGVTAVWRGVPPWAPLEPGAVSADTQRTSVAVLPFRLSGEDLELWREGIVDLLTSNLEGAGDLQALDAQSVMRGWNAVVGSDRAGASPAEIVDVARRLGVGFGIAGGAVRIGGAVRLTADVYDVASGRMIGSVQANGPADSVMALVDDLSVGLVRSGYLPVDRRVSATTLSRTRTSSLAAMKSYLQGERNYQRGRWSEAVAEFQRAVEIDSTFARAHLRLASAAVWINDGELHRWHAAEALRLSERLTARDQLLIRGIATDELAPLDTLTRRYPDDVEGWSALGDAAFHRGGIRLLPASRFRTALERSVELSPYYGEYYVHLLEDAFVRLDSARVRELLGGLESVDDERHPCPGYQTAYDLAWGTPAARRAAEASLASLEYDRLHCAWVTLAVAPAAADRIETLDRALLTEATPPLERVMALWRSLQARMMRGEVAAAHEVLALAEPVSRIQWDAATHAVSFWLAGIGDSTAAARAAERLRVYPQPEGNFWLGARAVALGRPGELARSVAALEAQEPTLSPERAGHASAYADALRLYAAVKGGDLGRIGELEAVLPRLPPASWSYEFPGGFLRYDIGRLLLDRGDYRGAERYFQSFYHYDWTWYVPAQFHLGRVYEALGQRDDARMHYQRFVAWWSEADPMLQPWVREAEASLAALRSE